MTDLVTAFLVLAGGFFAFAAALGVVRMPDLFIRMHASTKAGTLGAGLILAGLAVHASDLGVVTRALAAFAFLLLTAPVAAHMIGRAAYRIGVPLWEGSILDEMGHSLDRPPAESGAQGRRPDRKPIADEQGPA